MKLKNIFILLLSVLSLSAVSCVKEHYQWNPKERNVGTEVLDVNADELAFLPRGGKLNFTVNASYDGHISADEWISVSALEFPGDRSTYTVIISADPNKTGADRSGKVVIRTASLTHEITVTQPEYSRPDSPESIGSADDLVYWLSTCAPYCESDETMTLTKDIDMSGVDNLTPAESFAGTFDGNGHRITNWNSSVPLFVKNTGKITNLTVTSSCKFTISTATEDLYFAPFARQNYGQISSCTNEADILYNAESPAGKTYIAGIACYNYEEGSISNCINRGNIEFRPGMTAGNVFVGGIISYGYGPVADCENYGAITMAPLSATADYYYVGGISPRQVSGKISGCINHKKAKIYANECTPSKGYIGGILGFHDAASECTDCENYGDIECLFQKEAYIAGLMGWQAKVSDNDFTLFENSIVNCHITAYTAGKGKNGGNPCNSAGLVVGRYAGQSNAKVCNIGSAENPVKVSGSITGIQSGSTVTATSKDFGEVASGDGSGTSINGAASVWQIINAVYEVVGDGQTGDPEEIIINTGSFSLDVPAEGGEQSFNVKVNYEGTVSTEADWLTLSETTIPADKSMHEVTVTAAANEHTYTRTGEIVISMPMGTREVITVRQAGNPNAPESLEFDIDPSETMTLDPSGAEAAVFNVTANYDAAVSSDADWLTFDPETVTGDEQAHKVSVTALKNDTGADRTAVVTVTLPKGLAKSFTVSQKKFTIVPLSEIGTKDQFLEFVKYASNPEIYPDGFTSKITKDIDLSGVVLDPISDFIGILDGDGHRIKNWNSGAPLFIQTSGNSIVRNLVIDSSCKFDVSPEYAAKWGIFVGSAGPADGTDKCRIVNCINYAPIVMSQPNTAQAFIAVMAGRTGTGSLVDNCVNHGSIDISPAASITEELRAGGIVGSSNGSITNCKNDGPVSICPQDIVAKVYAGGIASNTGSQPVENCTNTSKGKITVNAAAFSGSKDGYVGGITGYNVNSNLFACKNFGDILISANFDKMRAGGLLGFQTGRKEHFTILENCVVNCNVTGAYASLGGNGSTTPLNACGLVIGRFGGQGNTYVCTAGTAEKPVKVAGSVSMIGGSTVEATAETYTNLITGAGSKNSLCGGSTTQVFNVIYESTTKE